jgi:uncharacterized protein YceK
MIHPIAGLVIRKGREIFARLCPVAILTLVTGGGQMTFRALRVALLLASLPVAGCGTAANLANQKPGAGGVVPFGGVRQDVACLQKAANGEVCFRGHPKSDSEQYPQRALMLFCAADLPLSLVGDLVTWPYTVVYTFINQPIPTPPVLIANPPVPPAIPAPPDTPPMPIPIPPEGQALPEAQPQAPPPQPLPKPKE